jgi:hypothetical protein
MTRLHTALLIALFAVYLYECLYWIGPDELAFTRIRCDWKLHRRTRLLRIVPVLSSPFLLRPGFLRAAAANLNPQLTDHALRRVAAALDKLWFARLQCRVQALLLLVLLPWLTWKHLLSWLYPEFCFLLLVSHSLILLTLTHELPRTRRVRWFSVAAPLLVNPLGATRLLDVIAGLRFREILHLADARVARSEAAPK